MSFSIEGPPNKIYKTKVVGVSHDNSNGINRQTILNKCYPKEEVFLRRSYNNTFDKYAIEVLNSNRQQIGFISSDLTKNLASYLDSGGKVRVRIDKIIGGPTLWEMITRKKGKLLGCVIRIEEEGFDLKVLQKQEPYRVRSKEMRKLAYRAYKLENSNPSKAIKLYKDAIEVGKEIDQFGIMAQAIRERMPITRLSILLVKHKRYEEAYEYLDWYFKYDDYSGVIPSEEAALLKRYERMKKKCF